MWDIFDASQFMPRSECGNWGEGWIRIAQYGYLMLSASYMAIPVFLGIFWGKRFRGKKIAGSSMLLLFMSFIFLCGLTHICDLLSFYWPAYKFFAIIYFVAGAVSLYTTVLLPFWVYNQLAIPSPAELMQTVTKDSELISQLKTKVNIRDVEIESLVRELAAERHIKDELIQKLDGIQSVSDANVAKGIAEARELLIKSVRISDRL